MSVHSMNRRTFLRSAGLGAAALAFGGSFDTLTSRTSWLGHAANRTSWSMARMQTTSFVPDAEIAITAAPKLVPILSGAPTNVWSYKGQLLSGSGVTVTNLPGTYLGPIIRVQSGKKVRIFFHNNLAEDSVIHPHGLRVPEDCYGQPMQAIGPGQTKVYEFQVIDRAGPYWFHPHPMGRTAEQVVMGLAGLFTVWDVDEEIAVPGASTGGE